MPAPTYVCACTSPLYASFAVMRYLFRGLVLGALLLFTGCTPLLYAPGPAPERLSRGFFQLFATVRLPAGPVSLAVPSGIVTPIINATQAEDLVAHYFFMLNFGFTLRRDYFARRRD